MDFISRHLGHTSIGCGILVFVAFLIINHRKGKPNNLGILLAQLFSASAIPVGIWLIVCAFQPALVQLLPDIGLYLAAAGLSLLYVSYKGIFS